MQSKFFRDSLRVSLTDECNFNCGYCHNEGQQGGHNFITWDFFDRFFDQIQKEQIVVNKVNLTGGEPLLHNKFLQMAERAGEVAENVTVNTNGKLLSQKMVKGLKFIGVNKINFGIDNPFSNLTKPTANGETVDHEKLIDIVRYATQIMPKSVVNIAVTEFNRELVPEILNWVIENKLNAKFIELIDFDFKTLTPAGQKNYSFPDLITQASNQFTCIEIDDTLKTRTARASNGSKVKFYEDCCNARTCANIYTRVNALGEFAPCIKGGDTYPITFDRPLAEQLDEQKKYACNHIRNFFPRDMNGNFVEAGA